MNPLQQDFDRLRCAGTPWCLRGGVTTTIIGGHVGWERKMRRAKSGGCLCVCATNPCAVRAANDCACRFCAGGVSGTCTETCTQTANVRVSMAYDEWPSVTLCAGVSGICTSCPARLEVTSSRRASPPRLSASTGRRRGPAGGRLPWCRMRLNGYGAGMLATKAKAGPRRAP